MNRWKALERRMGLIRKPDRKGKRERERQIKKEMKEGRGIKE